MAKPGAKALERDTVPAGGPVLEVEDLSVEFHTPRGVVHAVNGIGYSLNRGETLAILGESGSGKSVSAQAIMGLIDVPPGRIPTGAIRFNGTDLLRVSEAQRRAVRGEGIAMVFQDALSALNPVFTVGWQISELYRVRWGVSRREAKRRSQELMERVRIPSAKERLGDFPHEFSGGMRQRVMIAMALALDPDVLIADEPTTALDVTVQAQIMNLLAELQQETGMGLILITHDLGVVADVADRVAVMYAGRIVETGDVRSVYHTPAHPYTVGLMKSVPRLDQKGGQLEPIAGAPPSLQRIPPGCAFHPRCPLARQRCREEVPPLYEVEGERRSACHYFPEVLSDRDSAH